MIDIDYFKQVNHSFGHKIGDKILKKLAELCKQTLREVDIVGRISGEEFAVVLPETELDQAVEVGERLRESVAGTMVAVSGDPPLQFTISIGIVSLSSNSETLEALINFANAALYGAKNLGRNSVNTYARKTVIE